jgi:hypothetical protein
MCRTKKFQGMNVGNTVNTVTLDLGWHFQITALTTNIKLISRVKFVLQLPGFSVTVYNTLLDAQNWLDIINYIYEIKFLEKILISIE